SIDEVAQRLGLATMSIRRMIDRGEFISPIQVSPRRAAFNEAEVDAWLASRPRGKFPQPAQFVTDDAA
ncbi:MAG TPA: AlpA family phage regulatory protein, partial [Noviherbaspirillum sp.]